jgi:hypothetical protein
MAIPEYRLRVPAKRRIHHNIKALLQKKATEKWYRAVRIKNLTERSEAHSGCATPASVYAGMAQTPS